MTKSEFLNALKTRIQEYPADETQKSMEYYEEMIDDRMEDGMSEEEAIASLGPVEQITEQIKCELPLTTLVKQKTKEKTRGKHLPAWAVVLLILGFPVWGSVLMSILSMVFSFYLSIWVADLVLWIFVLVLGVMAICFAVGFIYCLFQAAVGSAFIYLGMSLLAAGITIVAFLGTLLVTKGICKGTKWCYTQIKKAIIGKEEA